MHNLFAMEAVSIAEALGVPSLAMSPCLVPQAPPASLARLFQQEHAALHAALTRPGASQPHSRCHKCRHCGQREAHRTRERALLGCTPQGERRVNVWNGLISSTGCGPS